MDNIHIIELSKLTTPNVVEVKNKDWVAYGDDNNYFQFIIDRYVNSTTNKTVIDSVPGGSCPLHFRTDWFLISPFQPN